MNRQDAKGAKRGNWFNRRCPASQAHMSTQMSADLNGWHRRDDDGVDAVGNQLRWGSMGVDRGRWGSGAGQVPAKARKHRAKPSRLAAAMERGSVGQAFLPARACPRRQECPRHFGAPFVNGHRSCRHLSIPVDTCRQFR
jgi:hypothetical protein